MKQTVNVQHKCQETQCVRVCYVPFSYGIITNITIKMGLTLKYNVGVALREQASH